jgi:hypothetical protein
MGFSFIRLFSKCSSAEAQARYHQTGLAELFELHVGSIVEKEGPALWQGH